MIATSLAVRFLLELAGLAAVGFAGAQAFDGPMRVVVAVAAPAAMALLWAVVAAPKARNSLSAGTRQLAGSGILLGAAGALGLAGQPALAALLAAAVIASTVHLRALGATDVIAASERLAADGAGR